MSPEALARLRKDLADQVAPSRDDLRALLDAYDTARAERDEAVDVLTRRQFSAMDDKCPECVGRDMSPNGETPLKHTADCSLAAVLAKAGRR